MFILYSSFLLSAHLLFSSLNYQSFYEIYGLFIQTYPTVYPPIYRLNRFSSQLSLPLTGLLAIQNLSINPSIF